MAKLFLLSVCAMLSSFFSFMSTIHIANWHRLHRLYWLVRQQRRLSLPAVGLMGVEPFPPPPVITRPATEGDSFTRLVQTFCWWHRHCRSTLIVSDCCCLVVFWYLFVWFPPQKKESYMGTINLLAKNTVALCYFPSSLCNCDKYL